MSNEDDNVVDLSVFREQREREIARKGTPRKRTRRSR